MSLILLAYAAGVLTILSPCILPVVPFVLAGAGKPLRRGALPMLAGMAVAFAAAASLAAVAGHWAVRAHDWGRIAALARAHAVLSERREIREQHRVRHEDDMAQHLARE